MRYIRKALEDKTFVKNNETVECHVMRKGVAVAVFLVVLVSTWLAYTKVAQSRRDASYRAAIAPFQRDLHLGMDRADVRKYLDSQALAYHSVRYGGNDADTYEIKIAEERSHSLVCENWNVYIALEFTAADKLRDLHIRKIGTCL